MSVENPLKWLLNRLPYEIQSSAQLSILMHDYEVNKAAYARQIKIRAIEHRIANLKRRPHEPATLERWQAKLKKLKEGS